jgi:hypothetical protein
MIQTILEWLDTKYIDFMMFWLVIGAGFLQQRLLGPFCWYKKDARSKHLSCRWSFVAYTPGW